VQNTVVTTTFKDNDKKSYFRNNLLTTSLLTTLVEKIECVGLNIKCQEYDEIDYQQNIPLL